MSRWNMILVKDDDTTCVGDELYYRGKKHNITLITENYITIKQGRVIKVAYDSNGYPYKTENNVGKQIRIPMETLNKLGWSVKHGN